MQEIERTLERLNGFEMQNFSYQDIAELRLIANHQRRLLDMCRPYVDKIAWQSNDGLAAQEAAQLLAALDNQQVESPHG